MSRQAILMYAEQILDNLFVAGQINTADLKTIADNGIQMLICNRPDDEEPGQPKFEDIKQAAETLGLQTLYLPFTASTLTPEHVETFKSVYKPDVKTLAYCRTGNRCKILIQASMQSAS